MRLLLALTTVATILQTVLAGPLELKPVHKVTGEKKAGSYIVTLKPDASPDALLKKLQGVTTTAYEKRILNGFSAQLDDENLNIVRASPDVEWIEEDGVLHTAALVSQPNPPWGLCRLSYNTVAPNPCTYRYDSIAGAGVDVYVISTGIQVTNAEFGGRAIWGATFGGYPNQDGHGQGTHCAGLIGSKTYGVAKSANLIAVKFLSDTGSGAFSDLISAINWSSARAQSVGRPCVIVIDSVGSALTTVDNAVNAAVAAGCHVVVAAGNSNANAANFSPARAASAITVGATTINDARASYSNYGAGVDILAPGSDIVSVVSSGTRTLSGTSCSACYVAGLVAYFISVFGDWTPGTLGPLSTYAVSGAITGVPSGTANRLANNEY